MFISEKNYLILSNILHLFGDSISKKTLNEKLKRRSFDVIIKSNCKLFCKFLYLCNTELIFPIWFFPLTVLLEYPVRNVGK